ncbi:MAG: hypothetical protein VX498_02230 [Myxococcota bacterium]|nr:hypothetical protein [Myxococcota bacterium]
MGFFGRLGNLGKGLWSSKRRRTDTSLLEAELEQDRLTPKPTAAAERELARRRQGEQPDAADMEAVQPGEPKGEGEEPESGPVKKTL